MKKLLYLYEMKKKWKDIKGYEGHYRINNHGEVFSVKKNKIMKPEIMRLGYLRIQLSKNGISRKILIHKIVATHFIDNPLQKNEINHIDEIKNNNKSENLEWVTHPENMISGTVQKRRIKSIDIESMSKKVYQYDKKGNLIKIWKSINEARRFGYSSGNISMFCNGKYPHKYYRGFYWSFIKK